MARHSPGRYSFAGALIALLASLGCGGGASIAPSSTVITPTVLNPVPTLASVSPGSEAAGSGAFTLTLNGAKFVFGAGVFFNGANRTATYVSSTQLKVAILASELMTTGVFPIAVINPAPGGGASNALQFTVLSNSTGNGNPVPQITSIFPTSAVTGVSAFNLSVTGRNFVSGSVVLFNNMKSATSYISGTQLSVAIAANDLTTAGSFPVTVINPAPGGGASNALQFAVLSSTPAIQHIIVIVKENHSFDNYFGQFPGANGATTGQTSTGTTIPLAAMSANPADCGHDWGAAKADINGGSMNGFDKTCAHLQAYVQASSTLIPNYWAYAHTYALADNMFAQNKGPSFPTHAYLFSESSNDAVAVPINVPNVQQDGWGCDAAAAGATVRSLNPSTGLQYYQPPCFTLPTMGEALDAAGVTWRIYSPQPGEYAYQWNFGSYYQNLWHGADRSKDVPVGSFCSDVASGNLPQVTWITPPSSASEHPTASITNGETWTVQQVNCVMNSPYWSSTLILLTWDDWGGFYDHVPPPNVDFFGYGIRVPLLAVSPFAKSGYIGHKLYSFDSINKTIENVFRLPCLLTDCGFTVNDLSDLLTSAPAAPARILTPQPLQLQSQPRVIDGREETSDDDD